MIENAFLSPETLFLFEGHQFLLVIVLPHEVQFDKFHRV
jgi:hypothetical protein